jgi:S-DNA-T family DNA segregation ATPase FtsK/SpoIIIE
MERRYALLRENAVRDIDSYHKNIVEKAKAKGKAKDEMPEQMPYIIIVIDELSDIMSQYPKELEAGIVAIAQKARAVGIHLILSTQRPSVNVVTGLIKANVPTRLALSVSSAIDSKTILDMAGAEKLLVKGDMLYKTGEMSKPVRVQSAFIYEEDVKKVVKFIKNAYKNELGDTQLDFSDPNSKRAEEVEEDVSPADDLDLVDGVQASNNQEEENFDEETKQENNFGIDFEAMEEDEALDNLFEAAKAEVIASGKASTSYLQRKLSIGYSRAAKIIDQLEERGIIGPANGSKPREVLVRE